MMAVYTERVQTVLTAAQYEQLARLAAERDKPLSVLIREAIEQTYLVDVARGRRQGALERLISLEAPVADWEQMEEEIEKGALDE